MGAAMKLITVGSSTGTVLSKDVLAKLRVKRGGAVYLTNRPMAT